MGCRTTPKLVIPCLAFPNCSSSFSFLCIEYIFVLTIYFFQQSVLLRTAQQRQSCYSSSSVRTRNLRCVGWGCVHAEACLPPLLPHGGALTLGPGATAMNGGLAAAPPLISVRRSLGDRLGLASGGLSPSPASSSQQEPGSRRCCKRAVSCARVGDGAELQSGEAEQLRSHDSPDRHPR